MNAQDAFKLTQENWAENEQKYLTYLVGFQSKVETAAKEGRTQCIVGVIPSGQAGLMDFVASFYEQQGYYVGFQGMSPSEIGISINWKNEPIGSRPYQESKDFSKMLNS